MPGPSDDPLSDRDQGSVGSTGRPLSPSLLLATAASVLAALLAASQGPLGAGVAVLAAWAAALGLRARGRTTLAIASLCAVPAALNAVEVPARPVAFSPGIRRLEVLVERNLGMRNDRLGIEVQVQTSGRQRSGFAELRVGRSGLDLHPGDRLIGLFECRPTARGPTLRADLRGLEHLRSSGPRALVSRLRWRLRQGLQRLVDGEPGAVLCHLVLGHGPEVSKATVSAHRATGLAHLLAVSGAHASLLAGLLALGYGSLRRRSIDGSRTFRDLSTAVLVVYGSIAGFEPPVLRAVLAWTLLTHARFRGRHVGWPGLLAVPALVTAWVVPDDLRSPSFWLSYAAILGLAAAGPFRRGGLVSKLATSARASAWAASTTAPFTLAVFGAASPWTVLGTPLCAPLVAFMLGLGLIVCLLEPLLPGLATVLAVPLGWCCEIYVGIVRELATWPMAPVFAPVSPSATAMFLAALAAATTFLCQPNRRGLALACAIGCLPSLIAVSPPTDADRFRLLAVGHGQAALLETRAGERVLIDCGSLLDGSRAARAVARASRPGRRRIDLLILTHADFDHWGGVPELLDRLPVTCAVLADGLRTTPVPRLLRAAGVPFRTLVPGEREVLRTGLLAIAPDLGENASDNDQSLWVRYDGDFSVLLPADAEGEAIELLLKDPISARLDVLVLPHHGRISTERRRRLEARTGAHAVLVSAPGAGEQEVTAESLHRGTWVLRATEPAGAHTATENR